MHQTYRCSRGLKGEAELDYFGPEGRVRGNLLYIAVLPEKLRFDVYSPFGVILSTLTADGKDFALYDLEHKSFARGPAKTCNVARFTQVPIPPFALVQLLRGEAPVVVHEPTSVSIRRKRPLLHRRGAYVVRIASNHEVVQEIELWPHPDDFEKPWSQQRVRVARVRVEQAGVVLYEAEMRGHRLGRTAEGLKDPDGLGEDLRPSGPPCAAEIPDRVHLRVPGTAQELILDNARIGRDVVHNPPLPSGTFDQDPPAGVEVTYADCH